MDKFAQIKQWLRDLSAEELEELRGLVASRLSFGISKPKQEGKEGLALLTLDCIVQHMQGKGVDLTPVPALQKSAQYPPFRQKIEGNIGPWLKEATGFNKVEMRTFIALAVELLHDNLRDMGWPITSRTMMSHIHRIPAVLDQQFPGYAESGLLGLIIRKEAKDVRKERSFKPDGKPNRRIGRQ